MHELSLCRSIEAIVVRAAGGRRVETVGLDVGQLRQVVPPTLEYCWGVVTEGGPLDGSALRINHIQGVVACRACEAETRLTGRIPMMLCGACGSGDVAAIAGEEFLVTTLELVPESKD